MYLSVSRRAQDLTATRQLTDWIQIVRFGRIQIFFRAKLKNGESDGCGRHSVILIDNFVCGNIDARLIKYKATNIRTTNYKHASID